MEYITPSAGPVIKGLEEFETVFAKDQPEYLPLRALTSNDFDRAVLTRWTPTEEQRKAIADGADIFLEQLTFQSPLQPIRVAVSREPGAVFWHDAYALRGSRHGQPEKQTRVAVPYHEAECEKAKAEYSAQGLVGKAPSLPRR